MRIANYFTETITLTAPRREKDRRVEVIATLPGGDQFKRSIWIQDREERGKFLNDLIVENPAINAEDRIAIRNRLNDLRKQHELDIEVHPPHGKVNGRASCSVDFYVGSKIALTESGNLLDSKFRSNVSERIASVVVGKQTKRLSGVKQRIQERLMEEVNRLRDVALAPPAQPFLDAEKIDYELIRGVGIIWRKQLAGGGQKLERLTNFTAKIVANVFRTDGVERTCELEIEAQLKSKPARQFTVKASTFGEMRWPMEELGGEAMIEPEAGFKERARAAIQKLSTDLIEKTLRTYTGWLEKDGKWIYMHAGGVITADDAPQDLEVALGDALAGFVLPKPPTDAAWLKQCVQSSLRMLTVAAPQIVYPVYCAIWRSLLGECDSSIFLSGRTQSRKSELASLAQRHFGAGMHAKALPGSWASTFASLIDTAFKLKDALFTIDDFKPGVLRGQQQDKLHKLADDILRAQGNRSARGRCNEYGESRASKPPRGMILSTGEEVPRGESLRARMTIVDVTPTDVDNARLTVCQKDARDGVYAAAMAGFIRWLAIDGRIGKIQAQLRDEIEKYRSLAIQAQRIAAGETQMLRTPENVANLQIGFNHFLEFAATIGAIDDGARWRDECWSALMKSAELQAKYQGDQDPASRFLQLIKSALASGLAHIAAASGGEPDGDDVKNACGYRQRVGTIWEAQRTRIGFLSEDGVCLNPESSFRVANEVVGSYGDGVGVTSAVSLAKHLLAKGLLLGAKSGRRSVARRFSGEPTQVWVVAREALEIPPGGGGGMFTVRAPDQDPNSVQNDLEILNFEPRKGLEQ